ncbi:MAG: M24 family metallopeptidase, partial [Cyanobacteria bacterium HKST-UBA06]|nr:M24 family metallopeptidase [Cyanobacteria bacterium HKST-UBA06]
MLKPIDRKSRHEMNLIMDAGKIVAAVHMMLMDMLEPGMSTLDLDREAEAFIRKHGAIPTFKGLYGFPATLCTSVNEEVVHGIPKADKILVEGDVISVDCGVTYRGYIADTAVTLPVGKIDEDKQRLLEDTDGGLHAAIAKMVPGTPLDEVSGAIEDYA